MTKKTEEAAQTPEEAVAAVDPTAVLAELLAAVKSLKDEQAEQKAAWAAEKANLVAQLETVKNEGARDINKPNVLPENAIDPRTDHPEKDIEVKLDCMAAIAELNGDDFDRERNRRILLGQPVEDLYPFRFNGRVFDTEADMEEYKERLGVEQARSLGKYR